MQPFVPVEALFKGRHFDGKIIILCVSWYASFKLSLRDLVIMMADRGVRLTHTTILRWVQRAICRNSRSAGADTSCASRLFRDRSLRRVRGGAINADRAEGETSRSAWAPPVGIIHVAWGERFFHVTDLDGYKLRFAGVPAFRVPRSDANPLIAWRYNLCRWRTL
jgi:hypothetical protein